jgi:hypothetical protein
MLLFKTTETTIAVYFWHVQVSSFLDEMRTNFLITFALHMGGGGDVKKGRCCIFYFGVLHPVARALSRLSEEPSFTTTVQDVYFTYI